MSNKHTLTSPSAAFTIQLGERLGGLLRDGDVICLQGDLGAGKTTFTQGIARGWGATEPAISPTFTLVNEYERPGDNQRLFHMDAYRLSGPQDARGLGLDDVLDAAGTLVVEWAERIKVALPDEHLWIALGWLDEDERRLIFNATGDRYRTLLAELLEGKLNNVAGN